MSGASQVQMSDLLQLAAQILVVVGQAIPQPGHLPVLQRVGERDGERFLEQAEQLDVVLAVAIRSLRRQHHTGETAGLRRQGHAQHPAHLDHDQHQRANRQPERTFGREQAMDLLHPLPRPPEVLVVLLLVVIGVVLIADVERRIGKRQIDAACAAVGRDPATLALPLRIVGEPPDPED